MDKDKENTTTMDGDATRSIAIHSDFAGNIIHLMVFASQKMDMFMLNMLVLHMVMSHGIFWYIRPLLLTLRDTSNNEYLKDLIFCRTMLPVEVNGCLIVEQLII